MSPSLTKGVHLWKDVSEAILNKDKNPKQYRRVFIGSIDREHVSTIRYQNNPRETKNYSLGEPFDNTYFTKREAECMVLILHGHTNIQVARLLNLSSRTIEFYIKNMRHKTGCLSKAHLMNCIAQTNFLDTLDFTMDDLA